MLCKSLALALFVTLFSLPPRVPAQSSASPPLKRPLITQNVDDRARVTLEGNVRPEATAENDRGIVSDDFPMEHMFLQLKRAPELEAALEQCIEDLHNPQSPNFHKWLSAEEFGERYGLHQQDVDAVTSWLELHGFIVNVVYTNGVLIDFSGTAGRVREAFQTEIHELDVQGVKHYANMQNPSIPEALAPAVEGVVSLHDFQPRPSYTFSSSGTTYEAVVPGDLAKIYNLNPLFSAGITGQFQTVVVVEDSNVYSTSDITKFRSTFGLSAYPGSFIQVHPAPKSGTNNCTNPGVTSNDHEATLDAEWAAAAAPSATIELASCTDTTTFGGLIALQNLLNGATASPSIISISYLSCEASMGATANMAYYKAYQQAVTQGVSVFVCSGDEGAAGCDYKQTKAVHGIGVNGMGSTPYNVSVGGTDFGDTYAHANSTYWNSTNSSTYESAKSYVPEIPWNDSCASLLIAKYNGFATTSGSSGFCNSSTGASYLTTQSGSGGPSGCATGTPSISGVVSGTCKGWPKPSWQTVFGNPKDGVRDLPDVSLLAAKGIWGHFYVFCFSDPQKGAPCTGAPDTWSHNGGTSSSTPIWAGFQALVNEKIGEPQGNPNPVLYQLASTEYGSSGSSTCNSTLGNTVGSACVFYDVTEGDMDVNCTGSYNCYLPSGTYGVLSTSNSSYKPAYGATKGWDFATGIGTANAGNLVNDWPNTIANFTLSASPSSLTIEQGDHSTNTITITPAHGFTGSVTLSAANLPSGTTATFSPNPATSTSTLTLTVGSATATGTYTLNIKGTSGALSHVTTIELTVGASPAAATPVITPPTGTYSGTQTVKITDATSGNTIYYTTNGTQPTTYSTKYTESFNVSTTTTVKAIAVAPAHSTSATATSVLTIK